MRRVGCTRAQLSAAGHTPARRSSWERSRASRTTAGSAWDGLMVSLLREAGAQGRRQGRC